MGRSSRLLSADRGRVRASRQLNPPSPASHPVEWHLPPDVHADGAVWSAVRLRVHSR